MRNESGRSVGILTTLSTYAAMHSDAAGPVVSCREATHCSYLVLDSTEGNGITAWFPIRHVTVTLSTSPEMEKIPGQ